LQKKQTFSPTADPNIVSRQRGILGCGRRPLSINSLQKRAKKNFSADLNLVSRHGGILGCGRRPLFDKSREVALPGLSFPNNQQTTLLLFIICVPCVYH
jgi:hypothetical protein